ncbi:hypothetical protein [Couchioplanes caeruleus]|uniref:hypothetical protein n=1 Tax=Couchioplanes caeruleus TaxID=56438 RepID=UPI000A8E3E45
MTMSSSATSRSATGTATDTPPLGRPATGADPSSRRRESARRPGRRAIGLHLDHDAITERLHSCLLTDAELADGFDAWRRLPDPFAGCFPLTDDIATPEEDTPSKPGIHPDYRPVVYRDRSADHDNGERPPFPLLTAP